MTTYQLFGATSGPGAQQSDSTNYTLAVEFYVTLSGHTLTEIRFWASGTVTGSDHACRLYEVTGAGAGTLVGGSSKAFPSPLVSGWNTVVLDTPIALTANQRYRAAVYFTTDNGYTATGAYWSAGAGTAGITSGPLVAPNTIDATDTAQSSFNPGSDAYPTGTFNSGNYWVDVTVSDGVAAPSTVTGTVAAALGGPTATVVGTHVARGVVASTLGGPTATVVGTHVARGVVAATLGGPVASLRTVGAVDGTISATLSGPAATVRQYVEPAVVPYAAGWRVLQALFTEKAGPNTEAKDCPNDGTLLLAGPGGVMFCPFDGYRKGR